MSATPKAIVNSTTRPNIIQRHPLWSYFIGAYLITWLIFTPIVLGKNGLGLLNIDADLSLAFPATLGPTISSIVVTWLIGGRTAVLHLLKRIIEWRVGLQWYFLVFYGFFLVQFPLSSLLIGTANFAWLPNNLIQLLTLVPGTFVTIVYAPLGEEIGWRGFALPRLQALYGPTRGTLLLGLIWAFWHAPLFLFVPTFIGPFNIVVSTFYVLSIVGLAVAISWLFNNTRGSLLIAMLAHSSFNFIIDPLLASIPEYANFKPANNTALLYASGAIIIGLVILALTRGKLDYNPTTQPQL